MPIEVDAVFENGVLKLEQPVPLKDGDKLRVTIHRRPRFRSTAGMFGFTGTAQEAEFFASDPELDYPPAPEAP